jgi:Flp pilus assembly protein TadG
MTQYLSSYRKGQTLVEFALLLPILLLITFVVIDLGRAVYYYSAIHNAAREGVRWGIVNKDINGKIDIAGMENTTVDYAFGLGLELSDVTAGAGDPQVVDGFANPTVRVKVFYDFEPATPVVSTLLPSGTITLQSEAVMRTEFYPKP